jgi:hypothetical protein
VVCRRSSNITPNMNTVPDILKASQEPIDNVIATVGQLSQAASKMPYYKFNNMWSRQMQGAVKPTRHPRPVTTKLTT